MTYFIFGCTRAFSICGVRASPVAERRLQSTGATVAHMGSVAPWHVESSQTRDQMHVPCTSRQILSQWATREVLVHLIFISSKREHQVAQNARKDFLKVCVYVCEKKIYTYTPYTKISDGWMDRSIDRQVDIWMDG